MKNLKLLTKFLVLFLVIAITFSGCNAPNEDNQTEKDPNDIGGEKIVVQITDEGLISGNVAAELADKYEDYVIGLRRTFHENPELGGQEKWTSERIRKELDEMGIPYEMAGEYGIVATIKGATKGKTIALRADMDALPIQEPAGLTFASKNEGVMHACGHDGHVAMLLGSAKVLVDIQDKLNGTVLLCFEQNEEGSDKDLDGAQEILDVIADKGVDGFWGMHVASFYTVGKLAPGPGYRMVGAGGFKVTIEGKGGHGAAPHMANDPILAIADIITSLTKFNAKSLDPFDFGVMNVCKVNAGTKGNIIPGTGSFEGTLRALKPEVGDLMEEEFTRIVTNVAEAHNVKAEIEFRKPGLAVYNNEKCSEIATEGIKKLYGEEFIFDMPIVPGSDTYAAYSAEYPSVYAFIGVGSIGGFLHSPTFVMDESALKYGVGATVQYTIDFLNAE